MEYNDKNERKLFIVLLSSFILLSFSSSYGYVDVITLAQMPMNYTPNAFRGGMTGHVGELCVACHQRFSINKEYADKLPYKVEEPKVLSIFPCGKSTCHYSTGPTRFMPYTTSRWSLHLNICENCHPKWNSSFDTIHNTHLNFSYLTLNRSGVDCKLCHFSPTGYNSSIAFIQPWPESYEKEIYVAPWNGSCAFCHFLINNATRVHDVHKPVMLSACSICHSEHILKAPRMFSRIGIAYPFEEKKNKTMEEKILAQIPISAIANETNATNVILPSSVEKLSPITELYLYFESIVDSLRDLVMKV